MGTDATGATDILARLDTNTETLMRITGVLRRQAKELAALRSLILTFAIVAFAIHIRTRRK
jgi:predicted component of type VI protein secretion system